LGDIGEVRTHDEGEGAEDLTDDYPGFAFAVAEVGVLFQEGRWLERYVQIRNLKEKGRSMVLKRASVL
jgi:hypothetical protein